jgi:hypothetical protein
MRSGWPLVLGVVAVAVAVAGCASSDSFVTPPPPSFREVRSLALVRTVDGRAGHPKDPLDGLDDSLRKRGYRTRRVELSGKDPAQADLARLFDDLELRASAPRRERSGTFSTLGRRAADTVAALGVDAVASYHRVDDRRSLPPPDAARLPGTVLPGPPVEARRGPRGALAVVDRTGHVAVFAWGETSALDDPEVPWNPAEAIDLLVRALSGEAAPEP